MTNKRVCKGLCNGLKILFFFSAASLGTQMEPRYAEAGELPDSRSFYMGFTTWPYDATAPAFLDMYEKVNNEGGLVAHHLQGGLPWDEALNKQNYHKNVEDDLKTRVRLTKKEKAVYLAVDAINGGRNGMAPYWSEADNEPLPQTWKNKRFSDPDVITAYSNFATDLIERFDAKYFNYGTEASELLLNAPGLFDDFLVFSKQVYRNIKAAHPGVIVLVSVSVKSPQSEEMKKIGAKFHLLMEHADALGVSIYPYAFFDSEHRGHGANLPNNWLSQVKALAGSKPIAITETGWIAQTLDIPAFGLSVSATPNDQNDYLKMLLSDANSLNARFVLWFTIADYDKLWEGLMQRDDLGAIWRDSGLLDGSLNPRPALSTWRSWRKLPRR